MGAVLASAALFVMPDSSALWMAAGLLWILDASINITMEPFRAFVADKLPEEQRTLGFVMQSFFIGIGQTMANALPFIFTTLGLVGTMASGIPLSVEYAFKIGAVTFLLAVLWTVFTSSEYPPDDMDAFLRMKREKSGFVHGLGEIVGAIRDMPRTMKELAVVQFFTWFALPCMWQFFGLAVARHVFGAPDQSAPTFAAGVEWAGLCFAVYNIACFAVAFLLPRLADLTSRKVVHIISLAIGGLGLLSVALATDKYFLCDLDDGRRHCVGIDPVDALRAPRGCDSAAADGRLHGRVQPLHRHSAGRHVVHGALPLQPGSRGRPAARGDAGGGEPAGRGGEYVPGHRRRPEASAGRRARRFRSSVRSS